MNDNADAAFVTVIDVAVFVLFLTFLFVLYDMSKGYFSSEMEVTNKKNNVQETNEYIANQELSSDALNNYNTYNQNVYRGNETGTIVKGSDIVLDIYNYDESSDIQMVVRGVEIDADKRRKVKNGDGNFLYANGIIFSTNEYRRTYSYDAFGKIIRIDYN